MQKLGRKQPIMLTLMTVFSVIFLSGPAMASFSPPPSSTTAAVADRSGVRQAGHPVTHGSDVFAIDQDHHAVVLFRSGQGPARTVINGLINPVRIAVDGHATIYVIDDGTHRLVKGSSRNGRTTVLRRNLRPSATMAVDDRNDLYVLDGTAVLKFRGTTGALTVLGSAPEGQLTVDGAGNVSVSYATDTDGSAGVQIKTFPAGGGRPTYRTVTDSRNPDGLLDAFLLRVIESQDGSLYLELGEGGASGATFIDRVAPRSSAAVGVNTRFAEYAYSVDRRSNFYLLENRLWCPEPTRYSGCVDDYAVDSIIKYAPGEATPTIRRIANVTLPVGGIAIDGRGNMYAAVVASNSATSVNGNIQPELVRIGVHAGSPTVLAKGHFSMPTVVDFCWLYRR